MANFNFNVSNAPNFSVQKLSVIETDCASQYEYKINSIDGNTITIELSGDLINGYVISNGSQTNIIPGSVFTYTFNTDLYLFFGINNSGQPGVFYSVDVLINDTTLNGSYEDNVQRQNDSEQCGSGGNFGAESYDELNDTPNSKIGQAGKYVRVNASEDGHEYVDQSNELIYPVENEYSDINEMLSDQVNQTENYFQYVIDAGLDPNISGSDEAYYQKLSTSTATLSDDYRLLSGSETEIITTSNSFSTHRIQQIVDENGTLSSVRGGRMSITYDSNTGYITSFTVNTRYSAAIQEYVSQFGFEGLYFTAYNSTSRRIEVAQIIGWNYTAQSNPRTIIEVGATMLASNFLVNDKCQCNIDIDSGGGGSTSSFELQINQSGHGLSVGQAIYFDGTNYLLSIANNSLSAGTIGIVKQVIDSDNFVYQFGGLLTAGSWTPGVDYFLDTSVPGLITTEPTYVNGQFRVYLGTGIDEGLVINIDIGQELTESNGNGGATLTQLINQVSHGLSVGQSIYFDGADYFPGLADNGSTSGILGVVSEVIDANTFVYQFGGVMTTGTWISGTDYFLSNTISGGTVIEPTYSIGDFRVYVGTGTEQGLLINIDIGQEITDQDSNIPNEESIVSSVLSGNVSAAQNIDLNAARMFVYTMTADTNFTISSGLSNNQSCVFQIKLTGEFAFTFNNPNIKLLSSDSYDGTLVNLITFTVTNVGGTESIEYQIQNIPA